MKRSNRLVILVGVLLAVLAFVAIVILLNRPEGDGGTGEPVEPETVTVLVATRDIAIGDAVTPDDVEAREVDPEAVQGTALGDTSLAGHAHYAWAALSEACHHHPYELAPGQGELGGWIDTLSELLPELGQAIYRESRA